MTSGTACADNGSAFSKEKKVWNHIIEVASRKIVAELPRGDYWLIYDTDETPNHYTLEVTWSDDSRSALIVYDSRYETDSVYLLNVVTRQVTEIRSPLAAAYDRPLMSACGRKYRKAKASDGFGVNSDGIGFVALNRFEVRALAGIEKQDLDYDYVYHLYFQTEDGGSHVFLVKAVHSPSEAESDDHREESADYNLDRSYRTLCGLLKPADRTALVEEERAWLTKRDAIKSKDKQDAFVEARTEELKSRSDRACSPHLSDNRSGLPAVITHS